MARFDLGRCVPLDRETRCVPCNAFASVSPLGGLVAHFWLSCNPSPLRCDLLATAFHDMGSLSYCAGRTAYLTMPVDRLCDACRIPATSSSLRPKLLSLRRLGTCSRICGTSRCTCSVLPSKDSYKFCSNRRIFSLFAWGLKMQGIDRHL